MQRKEWQAASAGTLSLKETSGRENIAGCQEIAELERELRKVTLACVSLQRSVYNETGINDTWATIRCGAPAMADAATPFRTEPVLEDS